MSIKAYWEDDAHTIIRYDFEGQWDWDDFYPVYNQVVVMANSVDYRVDVLLDMRQNNTFPKNILMHVKNIADKRPANMGKSIIVTENRFAKSLYRIGSLLNDRIEQYFMIIGSFEEAYAVIEHERTASIRPTE